ncbi:Hsp20/alpha crystallin family protein [Mycolicibacterium neworleansense]|uniref:Heat shock protein hspX n=1 Tax=Mycolicibacterium neworleansense TaxID=146018 RepID=A0A0H5S1Q6_9MYCO|nr:Hsp20/alpha crystallin family protein [Mycolicibacterium neworleansense]MCV7364061.1 Hsp20/alpha crystallin family protein [Mycolicibacterium neworleansense]CRZ14959.1 heat shock protein hspX [Mycolicibacterium neworleansense]
MVNLPVAHQPRPLLPELSEFFAGITPFASLRPIFERNLMRIEDEVTEDHYELRAEIPGIDPANDVQITVADGQLTVKAERSERTDTTARSEFSYGSFLRTVTLPAEADEDNITAGYERGILTVRVPLSENPAGARQIAIQDTENGSTAIESAEHSE